MGRACLGGSRLGCVLLVREALYNKFALRRAGPWLDGSATLLSAAPRLNRAGRAVIASEKQGRGCRRGVLRGAKRLHADDKVLGATRALANNLVNEALELPKFALLVDSVGTTRRMVQAVDLGPGLNTLQQLVGQLSPRPPLSKLEPVLDQEPYTALLQG